MNLQWCFFEETSSYTGDIYEESPPSESAPVTTIVMTLRGPSSSKVLASASKLLRLLAPYILAVVSNHTHPIVATTTPSILHPSFAPLLALAPAQALLVDDPLKELFNTTSMDFLHLSNLCVSMFFSGRHFIELWTSHVTQLLGQHRASSSLLGLLGHFGWVVSWVKHSLVGRYNCYSTNWNCTTKKLN